MSYSAELNIINVTDPAQFKSLTGGKVWFGVPNGSPATVPGDRIQVYLARQGLSDLAIAQPLDIGPGGQVMYSGQPAQIKVLVPYCVQIMNSLGVQKYYVPQALENNSNILIYDPPFDAATQTYVASKLAEFLSVFDFGADPTGVIDSTPMLQAAINTASNIGKLVFFPAGIYLIDGTLNGGDNLAIFGEGEGRTILRKKSDSSGHIIDIVGTSSKSNIYISGFSIDCNLVDAGIVMEHVSNVLIENCHVYYTPFWGINIGKLDSTSSNIVNDNITIRGCRFDNTTQTYEHLLIFNSKNVLVDDCYFKTAADGIGIGIYQNCDNVLIEKSYFDDMKTGMYYSLSTNNITVSNCFFRNNTNPIQGANLSDNGNFGYSRCYNIKVVSCTFQGNTGTPVEFGAVKGAILKDCYIDQNEQHGLLISKGGISVNSVSSDIIVQSCIFRNNNTSNISSINAPGILVAGFDFSEIQLIVNNCQFYNDTASPNQDWPIVFSGPYAAGQFLATNSRLSAYNSGESVGFINGASAGIKFEIINCLGVSMSVLNNVKLADARAMWDAVGVNQMAFSATSGDAIARITAGSGSNAHLRIGRVGSTDNGFLYSSNDNLIVLTNGASQAIFDAGGSFKPYTDNVSFLGNGSNRWKEIFAANGTVNTSDKNEKQQIRSLSNTEKQVALKLKSLVKSYKFNDAVAEKGDNARIHFGWIAQDVVDVFEQYGLDPMSYSVVCFDRWEDEWKDVFDENNRLIERVKIISAGSRFGLRYNELIAFIISSI